MAAQHYNNDFKDITADVSFVVPNSVELDTLNSDSFLLGRTGLNVNQSVVVSASDMGATDYWLLGECSTLKSTFME